MFSEEQTKELQKKLDPKYVASRQQGGRNVSYIEGWHAIAEANRIFGFDAWHRETVILNLVAEKPRKIGKGQYEKDGWGVTYTAKVRITTGDIVREGVGAGHGIDQDLGQAHESAIKEAETDAMKRALMTFGNPFGLALYDKTQSNVGVEKPEPTPAQIWIRDTALPAITNAPTPEVIDAFFRDNAAHLQSLTPEQQEFLNKKASGRRMQVLQAPISEAAE